MRNAGGAAMNSGRVPLPCRWDAPTFDSMARQWNTSPTGRQTGAAAGWLRLLALTAVVATASASTDDRVSADVITVTVPGCVIDPSDVIGWWPGQDNLIAAIGPDLTGTAGFGQALFGRGFELDGTNTVSASGLAAVSTGLTVEMWVKPVAAGFTGLTQMLASRWDFPSQDDSARTFALMLDPYANLVWTTDETSLRRPAELRALVPQIYNGSFHHVAATWDGSQMTIYFDGFPVASAPSQGGILNPAPSTPFHLGSKAGTGDPFHFSGIIDEPAVVRRALTAAEIDELVGAGPNGKCVFASSTGLIGPGLQVPADVGGVDPVVSPDGRYLLFRTRSTNVFPVVNDPQAQTPGTDLDLFDNYRDDLVLLDTQGTSATADDMLELVSVNSNELGGELDSSGGAITPNASHVAFSSFSNDLVTGDTLAGRDVFLRNRIAGTTERISVRSDGSQPQFTATGLNNDSRAPTIDSSGTIVAFESTNRNLAPETNPVPGDTWQTYDIYVRDISDPSSVNHTTERITVGIGDVKANGSSSSPNISPDGRYVWFSSAASNLTAGDTNGRMDLFVHDRQTDTTTRYDITAATGQPLDGDAYIADVSPDGRWLSFSSSATTVVVNDANGQSDAFLLDTQTSTVEIVSPALAPFANGSSFAASVSDDGQHVVFQSNATNLVPDDTNARSDVFVSNMITNSTHRISLDGNANQRNGSSSSVVATADGTRVYYIFQGVGEGYYSIWRSDLALP